MRRTFLKAKLHDARVTATHLEYQGSLTLDPALMREAGILPYERIEVYNVSGGQRFCTYAIEGREGSREVIVNGAAAHRAAPGDRIIVATYCGLEEGEIPDHRPVIVILDEENRVLEVRNDVAAAGA